LSSTPRKKFTNFTLRLHQKNANEQISHKVQVMTNILY
jgi:hypothetical protein